MTEDTYSIAAIIPNIANARTIAVIVGSIELKGRSTLASPSFFDGE